MNVFPAIAVLIAGYLLGSIPFGYILTLRAGLGDIRDIGSGNIGATNVLRTGNKKLAAMTLLLDALKGVTAVILARLIAPEFAQLAALAALLGHLFPVWLHFKGGKGVATALGIITALAWPVGIAVILTWLAAAKLFRYSSLAALIAIGGAPVYALLFGRYGVILFLLAVAGLVFWKHKDNIRRLMDGTESKIGQSGNASTPAE